MCMLRLMFLIRSQAFPFPWAEASRFHFPVLAGVLGPIVQCFPTSLTRGRGTSGGLSVLYVCDGQLFMTVMNS